MPALFRVCELSSLTGWRALANFMVGLAWGIAMGCHAQTLAAPALSGLAIAALDMPDIALLEAGVCDLTSQATCRVDHRVWNAAHSAARSRLEAGDFPAALAHEAAALETAHRAEDRDLESSSLTSLAVLEGVVGDVSSAARHLEALRQASPRRSAQTIEASVLVAAAEGDFRGALSPIDDALRLREMSTAGQVEDVVAKVALLSMRARLELLMGDPLAASGDVTRATVANRLHANVRSLTLTRALLDLSTGRRAEADATIATLAADFADENAPGLQSDALLAYAGALESVGDRIGAATFRARAQAAMSPPISLSEPATSHPTPRGPSSIEATPQVRSHSIDALSMHRVLIGSSITAVLALLAAFARQLLPRRPSRTSSRESSRAANAQYRVALRESPYRFAPRR